MTASTILRARIPSCLPGSRQRLAWIQCQDGQAELLSGLLLILHLPMAIAVAFSNCSVVKKETARGTAIIFGLNEG